jgi:hypothetical protein
MKGSMKNAVCLLCAIFCLTAVPGAAVKKNAFSDQEQAFLQQQHQSAIEQRGHEAETFLNKVYLSVTSTSCCARLIHNNQCLFDPAAFNSRVKSSLENEWNRYKEGVAAVSRPSTNVDSVRSIVFYDLVKDIFIERTVSEAMEKDSSYNEFQENMIKARERDTVLKRIYTAWYPLLFAPRENSLVVGLVASDSSILDSARSAVKLHSAGKGAADGKKVIPPLIQNEFLPSRIKRELDTLAPLQWTGIVKTCVGFMTCAMSARKKTASISFREALPMLNYLRDRPNPPEINDLLIGAYYKKNLDSFVVENRIRLRLWSVPGIVHAGDSRERTLVEMDTARVRPLEIAGRDLHPDLRSYILDSIIHSKDSVSDFDLGFGRLKVKMISRTRTPDTLKLEEVAGEIAAKLRTSLIDSTEQSLRTITGAKDAALKKDKAMFDFMNSLYPDSATVARAFSGDKSISDSDVGGALNRFQYASDYARTRLRKMVIGFIKASISYDMNTFKLH